MFEDSLFESTQRKISARSRWTTAASIAAQCSLAALLLILPLLHTESLPDRILRVHIALPVPLPPPPPVTVVHSASSLIASAAPTLSRLLAAPRILPSRIDQTVGPQTAAVPFGNMSTGIVPGAFLPGTGTGSVVVTSAAEKKAGPIHVSSGVVAGLLLAPIRPNYPPIAKAAHVEGTVIVDALISKSGAIESLHIVSGPAMLQTAALEAIRSARYRPFLLNGSPTEVQTTITVHFQIGS